MAFQRHIGSGGNHPSLRADPMFTGLGLATRPACPATSAQSPMKHTEITLPHLGIEMNIILIKSIILTRSVMAALIADGSRGHTEAHGRVLWDVSPGGCFLSGTGASLHIPQWHGG